MRLRGSSPHKVEVWGWVLRSRFFYSSCLNGGTVFSTNLPYFCTYGSSGWASAAVSP